jgi:hypothetical protein
MRRLLTCLALTLVLVGPAGAAEEPGVRTKLDAPDLARYLRWGPLRVRPLIEVEDVGYDDNIFSGSTNPEEDYTATIAPSVDGLVLLGSRAFFEFTEKLEYVTFVENSDQSYLNQLGEGRLTVPFRRMGVFADVQIDRVQERPQDQLDLRRNRDTNGFGGGVILLPGSRTELELSANWSDWEFSDEDVDPLLIADELDRTESGASLVARYALTSRAWLTLDSSTEAIEFENPVVIEDEVLRDCREWTTLVGMQFGSDGPLRGEARVGVTDIEAEDPVLPAFTEPVGDVSLGYQLNPRTTVFYNARRQAGFSASSDTTYFLIAEHEVRFLQYVTHFLGVEAATQVGRLTFPDAPEISREFGREDDIQRYEVALRLRVRENSLGRRVEYRLRASRYRRDSNTELTDVSRSTVGLGLVLGF